MVSCKERREVSHNMGHLDSNSRSMDLLRSPGWYRLLACLSGLKGLQDIQYPYWHSVHSRHYNCIQDHIEKHSIYLGNLWPESYRYFLYQRPLFLRFGFCNSLRPLSIKRQQRTKGIPDHEAVENNAIHSSNIVHERSWERQVVSKAPQNDILPDSVPAYTGLCLVLLH